jgi:glycosyltransferase involved in cell wall biosynthesis
MLDELVNPAMMQRLRAGVDSWVASSDAVASGLEERGIGAHQIVRCDPFIERPHVDARRVDAATRSLFLRPGQVVIGGIGGSNWQDAPDVFIRVAALMRRRWPELDARFVWVGAPDDGPTRWILDHDIRNAGLEGVVTLVGDLGDVETWLSTFDVLALTSRIGTLSSVAMQAGALAVPTVAFGLRAPLHDTDAQIGTRTVPYLDVEAMATSLHELAGDADLRATIGSDARRHVLEHGLVEQNADDLWELLQRSVRGRTVTAGAVR